MEVLFNENIIFIFFFAIIAIYNYSDMREYQKMAIIYISVYALVILNIIGVKMAVGFLILSLFCFFEIFTADVMKFKILVNPICKIVDFLYISFARYSFGRMLIALFLLRINIPGIPFKQDIIWNMLSVSCMVWALTSILQQKYEIYTFGEMYRIFAEFPINHVDFNKKLDEACLILTSIEDKVYFERKAYSFLEFRYLFGILKRKIADLKGIEKVTGIFTAGNSFVKNVINESRGYSTLPMQLIRSLGIKRGYNYKYRRKVFELLYARMFFKGIERMLKEDKVDKREHFKQYLLYIYFHKVNTFLGDATFSKFLNAFDMQYNKKNKKDIYDFSNEGIFIACMGLSKRANYIDPDNVEYYLEQVDGLSLNPKVICDMVSKMMTHPYNGN